MNSHIINNKFTIKKAIRLLNSQRIKCLVITDKKKRLIGTLTDGDIRRVLVKKKNSLDLTIEKAINKKPFFLVRNNSNKIRRLFLQKKINKSLKLVPIVEKNKKLIEILKIDDFIEKNKHLYFSKGLASIPAVIMAGGKGKRLQKFTELFPKPLLPYRNSTVLETIINRFKIAGIKNIYLTLNFKKNLIKSYINDKIEKINLHYIEEKKALGSAGSIAYLKEKIHTDFFLINCNTLANVNLKKTYNFKKKKKNDLTIIVAKKKFSIPYGSCEINKYGKFEKIIEKKNYSELINIGMYIFSSKIFSKIKINSKIDMDQLIKRLKKYKMQIGVYPISENSWVDTGTLENIKLKKF